MRGSEYNDISYYADASHINLDCSANIGFSMTHNGDTEGKYLCSYWPVCHVKFYKVVST